MVATAMSSPKRPATAVLLTLNIGLMRDGSLAEGYGYSCGFWECSQSICRWKAFVHVLLFAGGNFVLLMTCGRVLVFRYALLASHAIRSNLCCAVFSGIISTCLHSIPFLVISFSFSRIQPASDAFCSPDPAVKCCVPCDTANKRVPSPTVFLSLPKNQEFIFCSTFCSAGLYEDTFRP